MFIRFRYRLTAKPCTGKSITFDHFYFSVYNLIAYVHVLTLACVARGSRGAGAVLEEGRGKVGGEEKRFGVLVRRTLKRLYHRARSLASLISWLARRPRGRPVREFNLCANRGERVYAWTHRSSSLNAHPSRPGPAHVALLLLLLFFFFLLLLFLVFFFFFPFVFFVICSAHSALRASQYAGRMIRSACACETRDAAWAARTLRHSGAGPAAAARNRVIWECVEAWF